MSETRGLPLGESVVEWGPAERRRVEDPNLAVRCSARVGAERAAEPAGAFFERPGQRAQPAPPYRAGWGAWEQSCCPALPVPPPAAVESADHKSRPAKAIRQQ
jgi:hypothetical protein